MKLAILGTGNMAEALIAGVLAKKLLRPGRIIGFDVNTKRLQLIRRKYRIQTSSSAVEAIRRADMILLSVKPQQMKELLGQIRPKLSRRHLILSIAAGLDIRFFEKGLGRQCKIIRSMPNTPATVGMGATAYFANRNCHAADRKITQKIFGAAGIAFEVKSEKALDAVTGLSGSGPAFVCRFADALIQGGKKAGLSEDLARALTVQTLAGSAALLKQSGENPASLIQKVASKGGTTEAGLKVLKRKKFGSIVQQCVVAATRRARKLRNF
ncbi:MAG: pyrroline-5-carboxylate reductase [Deltaproteobacteria bacterium]|nr:pyrroline-5-carboxylate reductase [Deltaproteobacteria bacterium]